MNWRIVGKTEWRRRASVWTFGIFTNGATEEKHSAALTEEKKRETSFKTKEMRVILH